MQCDNHLGPPAAGKTGARLLRGLPFRFTLSSVLALAVCACQPDKSEAPRPEPSATPNAPALPTTPPAPEGPLVGPRMEALRGEDWNASQIEWHPYKAGLARAKTLGKPVCLIFYTGWCPHCKTYSRVFEDPKVVERAKSFVMIRVNADEEEDIAQQYTPDGSYIPRTFFLSPDGALEKEIHAPRDKFMYFFDEHNPASVLGGMDAALRKLVR